MKTMTLTAVFCTDDSANAQDFIEDMQDFLSCDCVEEIKSVKVEETFTEGA